MKTRLLKGTAQDTLKVVFLGFGQDLTPFFSLKLSSDTLLFMTMKMTALILVLFTNMKNMM